MKRASNRQGKDKALQRHPKPSRPAWKTHLIVFGSLTALMVFMVWVIWAMSAMEQRRSLCLEVERWKTAYHLTDDQAAHILQLEIDFHSRCDLFSIHASIGRDEELLHHKEISSWMSASDGARFMETQGRDDFRP